MLKGTVVIFNSLIGFYIGSTGAMVQVMTGDGKVHSVQCLDKLEDHEVVNPYALAHLHYSKLEAIALASRNPE